MQTASRTHILRAELGQKRRCLSCAGAFFDLNHDPIHCPKCAEVFHVVELAHSTRKVPWRPAPVDRAPTPSPAEDEASLPEVADDEHQASIPPIEEDEQIQRIEEVL